MTAAEETELLELLEAEQRDLARSSHLEFMAYTWPYKSREFTPGFHTKAICKRIDQAFVDFRKGKSTFLLISVPPRHGKTDMVSRWLGPHFLGEFPDAEIIQTSYQAGLAAQFAATARDIFRSREFGKLYPRITLSTETNQKANWVIVDVKTKQPTGGKLYATGLQSGITGNGGALVTIDDYFAGRKEAESLVQRDNAWQAFTNDVMTRLAPVSIVIVLATQWHVDDINGRIRKHMASDPDFPRFEVLRFPARARDYRGPGKYPSEFLFEERYGKDYYRRQYATLGKYSSAALLDCDPQMRSGAILNTDGIDWVDRERWPDAHRFRWARVWDLAHTAKQRQKDDPDWTGGTLLAFEMRKDDPVPHLWIQNVRKIREGATKRDAFIRATVDRDGKYPLQAVENSIDTKDAYDTLRNALPDVAWREVSVISKGDKVVRATPLEPIFEAPGHVHVLKDSSWGLSEEQKEARPQSQKDEDWNDWWLDQVMSFDGKGNAHDEAVDNMSAGYILLVGNSAGVHMSQETAAAFARRRRG